MSGQPNEKPTFTFGQASSTAGSGNLFGQNTSAAPASGGLFGSTTSTPASSGGGLFGAGTSTAPTGSLFGSNSATTKPTSAFGSVGSGSNLFGGANKPASGGFSFGSAAGSNASGGGLFGSTQSGAATTSTPAPAASIFSTPNKPTDAPATSQPATNIFGSTTSSGNLFGNPSSGQGNSSTPTNKPPTSLFGNSTTPAGPPPATSGGAPKDSPFKFAAVDPASKPTNAPSPFAQSSTPKPTENASQEAAKMTSTAPAPSLFGATANSGAGSGLFGNRTAETSQPPTSLFGNSSKGPTATGNLGTHQQPQTESKPTSSLFQNIVAKATGSDSAPQTSNAPSLFAKTPSQPTFSFAKPSAPASSSSSKSPTAAAGGFTIGQATTTAPTTGASTATPSNSLFPALSKPQDRATTTVSETPNAPTAAASTSAPSGSSLFGSIGKPQAPSGPESISQTTKAPAEESKIANNANLSASTTGPAPTGRSRLKDKTMDDIITRWASDLSKYQKQFQAQGEKVAEWDRMLVENSEKIQRLYGSTLEAERATSEVERQLSSVESDQAELEQWLDHYEKEVNQMMDKQIGQGDGRSGPDAERERTYQLATKISDRLEEMGQDLGSMIEEINDTSSDLTKRARPDDPLSHVVRVLNNHLSQLQQIDQGANALQLKVKEAQKAGHGLGAVNGLNGPSSDAAESFYRSYLGRGR